jgi:hypothetical protein
MLKGMPLADAVAEYELLDTKEIGEGLFVLDNGPAFLNSYKHIFFVWLVYEIDINHHPPEETYREDMDRIFYQLIEHDWSILALLGVPDEEIDSLRDPVDLKSLFWLLALKGIWSP